MDEGDDTNEEDVLPTKKPKLEGITNKRNMKNSSNIFKSTAVAVETKIPNANPIAEKKVDLVKDGVAEAEAKAAKERQIVPLEIRVKQFKDMLKEKEVSAFSTWEKELHKIVFDPRCVFEERLRSFDP